MKPNQNAGSRRSPTAWIFLGLAVAVVVSAIALSGLILVGRNSPKAAKRGQPAQVRAADGVATVQELVEPWSSKTFIFRRPETKEDFFDCDSLA